MKIGNIEVKRPAEGVITIQQHGENESRCFVLESAKQPEPGEVIVTDYLNLLAGAVADMTPLTDRQMKALERCIEGGVSMGWLHQTSADSLISTLAAFKA